MDHVQARGVLAGTTMGGDAALQSSLVTRERETVTDLVMEVNMMVMLAVKEILSAEVTTVSSLENITILKMTAVRDPQSQWPPPRAVSQGRRFRGPRAAPCSDPAEKVRLTVTMTVTVRAG